MDVCRHIYGGDVEARCVRFPVEPELLAVVSHLAWLLGIEL